MLFSKSTIFKTGALATVGLTLVATPFGCSVLDLCLPSWSGSLDAGLNSGSYLVVVLLTLVAVAGMVIALLSITNALNRQAKESFQIGDELRSIRLSIDLQTQALENQAFIATEIGKYYGMARQKKQNAHSLGVLNELISDFIEYICEGTDSVSYNRNGVTYNIKCFEITKIIHAPNMYAKSSQIAKDLALAKAQIQFELFGNLSSPKLSILDAPKLLTSTNFLAECRTVIGEIEKTLDQEGKLRLKRSKAKEVMQLSGEIAEMLQFDTVEVNPILFLSKRPANASF